MVSISIIRYDFVFIDTNFFCSNTYHEAASLLQSLPLSYSSLKKKKKPIQDENSQGLEIKADMCCS